MPKLLLVEGLPQYDRVNEAKLIHETFGIVKKGYDGRRARYVTTSFHQPATKKDFLELLEEDYDYIHISAHGEKICGGKGVIYVRNRGVIKAKDLLGLDIKAKVIFVNSCKAYIRDLKYAFLAAGSPKDRVYIAPKNDVYFDEAYLIALLFWKRIMLDKKDSWQSLANYAYKLPGFRANFWHSDEIDKALVWASRQRL